HAPHGLALDPDQRVDQRRGVEAGGEPAEGEAARTARRIDRHGLVCSRSPVAAPPSGRARGRSAAAVWAAADRWGRPVPPADPCGSPYCSSRSAAWVDTLAWASTEMPAFCSTWLRVSSAVSEATSTSRMRDSAAAVFSIATAIERIADSSRFCAAPNWARSEETESIAASIAESAAWAPLTVVMLRPSTPTPAAVASTPETVIRSLAV